MKAWIEVIIPVKLQYRDMPFPEHTLKNLCVLILMLPAPWSVRVDAQSSAPPNATGTFTVNVVDAIGNQGIPGATFRWVVAGPRLHLMGNWTSDHAGGSTLQFSSLTGDESKLWAIADGYVPAEFVVRRDLAGALPNACTVRLERAVTVGGIIVNEAGEPVAGVEIFMESAATPKTEDPSPGPEARDNFHYEKTDGQGRWTCHHAPKQLQSARFRLIHPDYVMVMVGPEASGRPEENVTGISEAELLASRSVFIMKRGLTISGRVLDSNLKPVEGAEVTGGDYPVWTPAAGRFSLKNRPAGVTLLTAQAKGFSPQQKQFSVSNGMDEVRFQLEPGHTLKMRVLNAKGVPVPGARIAAENWRGKSADQWQWDTDAQGRLVWDSAPTENMLYSISRPGYETVRSQPLQADGREHRITLHTRLQISGSVVDFETRNPLDGFRVFPGVLHAGHHDWNQSLVTNGQKGKYAVALPKQDLPHILRVEADGYYPEISRAFKDSEEQAAADFSLQRGEQIGGTVHLPDGSPAARAQVSLCLEDGITVLAGGRFVDAGDGAIQETDGQGGFLFQPRHGVKMIAVTHEQGYVEVSLDDWRESNELRLKPWGRIEGVLLAGAFSGKNELVQMVRVGQYSPRLQVNSFTALTDHQGRFTFERVPPGEHIIGCLIDSKFSHGRAIKINSGETSRLVLGEGGRKITGRVTAADGRELVWESGNHPAFLQAGLPSLTIPELPDGGATNRWLRAYWDSAEGRARQISEVRYMLRFESNNVFHVENVPAGAYECEIHYHEPSARAGEPDACLGIMRKAVVIPELQRGQRDEPWDLGEMTITLKASAH